MPLKQVRKWLWAMIGMITVLIIAIMMLVADYPEIGKAGMVVLLILFGGFGLVSVKYWRCPSCDKALPFRDAAEIAHCPFCGKELGL